MPKARDEKKVQYEVFKVTWAASKILTEITSQVRLKTGVKITKTAILTELLHLLKSVKIDPTRAESAEDVIGQLKESIRKGK